MMFIKIFQTLLAISIFFVLCSCQSKSKRMWTSDDLIISDQSSFASLAFPQMITSAQAKEDIDFLIFALSKAYGGRQYAPENSFAKAIATLKDISNPSTLAEFHDQIDEALFSIPDNHMMAYYKGKISKKRHDYQLNSQGQVGSNNISDAKKIWETRIDRVGNKKVLYISIVSFPSRENEIWNGFISSVSSQMKRSDSIVIDLRGNSGGDDTKGMELAEVLFGHPIEHPIKRQYRSQTPETMALLTNRLAVEIINMRYEGQTIPDYMTRDLNNSMDRYGKALKGEIPAEFIRTDKGTGSRSDPITGYKKPIYILMDRACASSGEFTIAAFEWNKYVKRVGENTHGTFHFSNAGIAVLPNSKFKVMIPSQYSEYYDRRFIERIGLTPDIKVSPSVDAYEIAKKIISDQS